MTGTIRLDPTIGRHLEEPVTLHMRRDFVRLDLRHNVAEALDSIRRNPPQERVIYFYVVDEENRLQGVVPTRRLLLSPSHTPITEIMVRKIIAVPENGDRAGSLRILYLAPLAGFPCRGSGTSDCWSGRRRAVYHRAQRARSG